MSESDSERTSDVDILRTAFATPLVEPAESRTWPEFLFDLLDGRHSLFPKLGNRAYGFSEINEPHPLQHLGSLGELDVSVFDNLDEVAPRVKKVEKAALDHRSASCGSKCAHRRAVIDDKAEVSVLVAMGSFAGN